MKSIFSAILIVALLSVAGLAHGSMEHILGTIISVSTDAIVVKTTAGETKTVKIDATTKVLRGDTPASPKDLHPGDRVVIHATKREGALVAAEIKVSAAQAGAGQTTKHKGEQ